ncbi:MAG: hypothetical protein IKS35_02835 [Clostridia bacterium]|nr:hypothetical protein [Clostridia bacterium]
MKSDILTITSRGEGVSAVLALTEKTGDYVGLDQKDRLHLRLLAEELTGLLRGIAGQVEAEYWLEAEGKKCELHLKSEIRMNSEMKEQFLSVATDGTNAAAAGVTGKIRVFIAAMLTATKDALPYAMINTAAAYPMGGTAGETAMVWSMAQYRDEVQKHRNENGDADKAWDELEKSVVSRIADDVKVKVVGRNVELIATKQF